jgi:hypothetical protein
MPSPRVNNAGITRSRPNFLLYITFDLWRSQTILFKVKNQNRHGYIMDNEKQVRGRPFSKGNPGRKLGSKNKATIVAASLAGETGEEILRKAIEMAMGGNVAMIKFLLDRILPKERPIQLELPHLDYAHDSVDAMAEIVDAVSSGRISPREAADVAQLVSAFTRAIDITEAQHQIDLLKSKLDGTAIDRSTSDANGKKNPFK